MKIIDSNSSAAARRTSLRTLGLIFVGLVVSLPALGQIQARGILPFSQFVNTLGSAQAGAYTGRGVRSAGDFYQMRQHLLSLYSGVTVSHSYELGGQIFDCVPIMQQPGVRLQGITHIASPPPFAPTAGVNQMQVVPGSRDAFGNVQQCADGTIPMRRITLDELTRYQTLQQFFRKSPGSAPIGGSIPATTAGPCSKTKLSDGSYHCYAEAYQFVNNYGGQANHNLWVPYVNTSAGQTMSLSQQWYVGGTGSSTQTAEIGWQNQPQKWGGQKSVLFIYWTANDYSSTGCYNISCAGFVQTNKNISLGGSITPVSVSGGSQYGPFLGYYYSGGNWWAAYGSNWIGYYPGSVYKGGQLSKYATLFQIGGEVATNKTSSYPPMGSGQWASEGFAYAAFDNDILYRDSGNGGHNPQFYVDQSNTACYTATTPAYSTSAGWATYFYFGGPGGSNC